MADTDTDLDIAKAGRLVKLALIVLVVALLVLAIDYRLKNYIIKEGQKALILLDQAKFHAEKAGGINDGTPRADASGATDSGAVGAVDGVGDDASAGTDVDPVANGSGPAPASGSSGTRGRAPGHGGRAGGAA